MPKKLENPQKMILRIAKFHLVDQGIESLNIRAIAKDAEVSIGTFYNYFPNKDCLLTALMADFWDDFLQSIQAIENEGSDYWSKQRKIFFVLKETYQLFCMDWLTHTDLQCEKAKLERMTLMEDQQGEFLSVIEQQFQQYDIVSVDFSSAELARFVLSNWLGMLHHPDVEYDFFERVLKKLIET